MHVRGQPTPYVDVLTDYRHCWTRVLVHSRDLGLDLDLGDDSLEL